MIIKLENNQKEGGVNVKNPQKSYVKRIIDGDTFQLTDNRRIRLAGIDAPEMGNYGSIAAKRQLEKLIPPGTYVKLDIVAKDKYNRLIAHVSNWNKSVNHLMKRFLHKIFN